MKKFLIKYSYEALIVGILLISIVLSFHIVRFAHAYLHEHYPPAQIVGQKTPPEGG